jgi:hypothetical protein
MNRRRWRAAAIGFAALLMLTSGCTLMGRTLALPVDAVRWMLPGTDRTEPVDPVELQEQLLRYADSFTAGTISAMNKLLANGQPPPPAQLLALKIWVATESMGIATGANALGNLVDMVVLTSGARIRVQDFWMPKVYGDSALPMLETLQRLEVRIWAVADKVLKPPQRAELRDTIDHWRKQSIGVAGSLSNLSAMGLISEITKSRRAEKSSSKSSVFGLLDIDPLAGLDPATRELAQTRLFAERALYIGQRMPRVLQWQAELLTLQTAAIPEVRQAVDSSTQLAASGDRLSRVAEQAPTLISSETSKIIAAIAAERAKILGGIGAEREKLLEALQGQQPGLTALAHEVGQVMAQGTKMADATGLTLKTFQGVMADFRPDLAKPEEPDKNREPFRIKDYAETAAEIARMSDRLTVLLNALQPTLSPEAFARIAGEADAVAARTQQRGQDLVDYAFRKALQWAAATVGLVLAASLVFRALGRSERC